VVKEETGTETILFFYGNLSARTNTWLALHIMCNILLNEGVKKQCISLYVSMNMKCFQCEEKTCLLCSDNL